MSHNSKNFSVFGKLSFRQNVFSAKSLLIILSVRQNVRSTKCPSAKCPFGKMSFGKVSFGKVSFGKMSGYPPSYLSSELSVRSSVHECNTRSKKIYMQIPYFRTSVAQKTFKFRATKL